MQCVRLADSDKSKTVRALGLLPPPLASSSAFRRGRPPSPARTSLLPHNRPSISLRFAPPTRSFPTLDDDCSISLHPDAHASCPPLRLLRNRSAVVTLPSLAASRAQGWQRRPLTRRLHHVLVAAALRARPRGATPRSALHRRPMHIGSALAGSRRLRGALGIRAWSRPQRSHASAGSPSIFDLVRCLHARLYGLPRSPA